jgi:hypothetical protein
MKLFKRLTEEEIDKYVNDNFTRLRQELKLTPKEACADAQLASCEQQVADWAGDEKEVREQLKQVQDDLNCNTCQYEKTCNYDDDVGKYCDKEIDQIFDLARKPLVARIALLTAEVEHWKLESDVQKVLNATHLY